MYWILATVFILIALIVPRLRPVGVIGCVVLGAMLAWGMVQRLRNTSDDDSPPAQQRGRPISPAAQVQAVPIDQVTIDDLRLTGSGAPFTLRGRIGNSSDLMLKSVTILVTRRACFEGALDPSGCNVLWQDKQWVAVSVPPHQSREFASSVWMRGAAPATRGRIEDSFEVVAAAGELTVSGVREK